MREGRHLAAIMFMDMVGYSARMQASEAAAIAAVQQLWDLVRPILISRGGQEVDLAGDGMLMEFPGALAAVRCALDVHAALHARNRGLPEAERILTRAAVHLGDIEHRNNRIYGDGVNIAARLLPLAPPGSIAMSAHVRDQLLNALEQAPQPLGPRTLKNIKAPMEIWCLPGPECSSRDLAAARAAARDESSTRRWSFGKAELDERTLELSVAGQSVSLEKKVLEVLMHLLEHAGEVVTKDELIEAVWPGRVIAESTLTSCVGRLRAELEDDAIKTVHGFGYRLAVPVTVETSASEPAPHFDFAVGTKPPLRPLWSLVERLGSGGRGEAWLARHDKTREPRVFKFALDVSALSSLKREITIHRVLRDALGGRVDYLRIYDWNIEEPPYFLESEYADAGNLAQWAERQGGLAAIALETRIDLAAQIAEALAAAHSVGVLHKDLKPSNVLVDTAGGKPRTRLADFGSGGVLDPKRLEQLGITRMGFSRTVLDVDSPTGATPMYLAPEVLAGQPCTVQSDLYALGVTLYQLVVGDFRKTLAPGWEREIGDELLREDIADAAAGDPSRRLPDVAQLAQRLRTLGSRRSQRVEQRAAAERAEQARQEAEKLARLRVENRRLRWTAAVVLLLSAAAIAASTVAYRQRNISLAAEERAVVSAAESMAEDSLRSAPGRTGPLPPEEIARRIAHYVTLDEKVLEVCKQTIVINGFGDPDGHNARCPDPYVRETKDQLADLYVRQRRFREAIPLYAEFLQDPREDTPDVLLAYRIKLAAALADAGEFERARTSLTGIGGYESAEKILSEGGELFSRGDRKTLLGMYRRVEGLLAAHDKDYVLARQRFGQALESLHAPGAGVWADQVKQDLAGLPPS